MVTKEYLDLLVSSYKTLRGIENMLDDDVSGVHSRRGILCHRDMLKQIADITNLRVVIDEYYEDDSYVCLVYDDVKFFQDIDRYKRSV